MNKMVKYKTALFTLAFSLFLVFIPNQVHGFVFDLAKAQLGAISEKAGPFVAFFISTFLFFVIGYLVLWITTSILQGIIMITPTALTVTGDGAAEFVRAGWSLSAGIVNLLLIIAFIVIAFAVIMGSEKIQFKKALPNLIVVALLVNFTLLFVGIGIDVSNFLFNTIATQFMVAGEGGGNIFLNALNPLFAFSSEQITAVMIYMGITAAALLIPYVNVAVQVGWVVSALFSLSSILQFIFYGAIMWSLSAVFFVYFVVFLSRIYIIQVLAILAPLAFFCLIFDETKKWWKKWLDALIEWLFVGVIFIFLMYIALALAPMVWSLSAPFQDMFPEMIRWFTDDIISHLALLIYFVVVIGIAKSFVPAAASAIISQASGIAKAATPWVGAIAKGAGKRMRGKELERQEEIKERESLGEKPWWSATGAQTRAMKLQSWMVRGAHSITGTGVQQGAERDIEANVKNFKENYDPNDLVQRYQMPGAAQRIMQNPTSADIAALQFMSENGADALASLPPEVLANLIKAATNRGFKKITRNAVKHIPDYGDVLNREEELEKAEQEGDVEKIKRARENLSAAEKIQSAMMSDIKKINPDISKEIEKLKQEEEKLATAIKEGDSTTQTTIEKRIKEIKKGINKLSRDPIYKISVQSLKAKDIENLSDSTVRNKGFQTAVIQNKEMSFIAKLLEDRKNGPEIIREISSIIEDQSIIGGAKGLKDKNPILYNQIKNSNIGQSIFGDIHKEIKKSDKKGSEKQEGNKQKKK